MVAALVGTLWAVGAWAGVGETLSQDGVRDLVERSGVYGGLIFIAAFTLGQMMHLPGLLFVAGAAFAWGPAVGSAMSAVGATAAVSANFLMVRYVGGGALAELRRPMLERVIFSLHRRPRVTMLLARGAFMTSPLLTTMLALSGVRMRDHTLTSAIGMIPLIIFWSYVLNAAVF
jgi:uncharacterized membrane protein YdjX (TVP38/TMEM64 family)